jgi:hypothetical protein
MVASWPKRLTQGTAARIGEIAGSLVSKMTTEPPQPTPEVQRAMERVNLIERQMSSKQSELRNALRDLDQVCQGDQSAEILAELAKLHAKVTQLMPVIRDMNDPAYKALRDRNDQLVKQFAAIENKKRKQ